MKNKSCPRNCKRGKLASTPLATVPELPAWEGRSSKRVSQETCHSEYVVQ